MIGTPKKVEKRKKIPTEIETSVLVLSRRRCCICFGLHRNAAMNFQGQIAHLDGDPSNSALENLAYLCLAHHDQYDSKSRQTKGMTIAEVKHFRSELYEWVKTGWKEPPPFPPKDSETSSGVESPEVFYFASPVSGHYVREGEDENAELEVLELANERVFVWGLAFRGIKSLQGPRVNSVTFIVPLSEDGTASYSSEASEGGTYTLQLEFKEDRLVARESGKLDDSAMSTTFSGVFRRVAAEPVAAPPSAESATGLDEEHIDTLQRIASVDSIHLQILAQNTGRTNQQMLRVLDDLTDEGVGLVGVSRNYRIGTTYHLTKKGRRFLHERGLL